jgi:hypothetical protein
MEGVRMKATPKSCGCSQCKRARADVPGLKEKEERAFRHRMNDATRTRPDDVVPAGSRPRNG